MGRSKADDAAARACRKIDDNEESESIRTCHVFSTRSFMSTKRRAQASLPQPHKRHKRSTSPPFHCISSAAQILQSEAKEPNVSLKLRVVMMWPLPEARRVSVEDLSSKETCRNFEILFVGKCFRLWSNLNLAVNDQILLSLRGSTFVRKPPGTHNTVKLPFDLIYEEGCLLRFTARKGIPQQETVNIWLSTSCIFV